MEPYVDNFPPPSREDLYHGTVSLGTWDIITIVGYFVIVMAVGIVVSELFILG
jgi:hypothetical protein